MGRKRYPLSMHYRWQQFPVSDTALLGGRDFSPFQPLLPGLSPCFLLRFLG